jgi:hypothetical protein
MKQVDELVSNWADETECSLCPLNRVKAGVAVHIKQLCASPEVARRLREIGFGEAQTIIWFTRKKQSAPQSPNHSTAKMP